MHSWNRDWCRVVSVICSIFNSHWRAERQVKQWDPL